MDITYKEQSSVKRTYSVPKDPKKRTQVPGVMASMGQWSAWGKEQASARIELLKLLAANRRIPWPPAGAEFR
jgi:hypothetical protein